MKKLLYFTMLACMIMSSMSVVGQTKPVKGTWLNLPYQDTRNKYMNPAHVDYTSPAFWEVKVQEMHDFGVDYLVLMAIADEQKSFYPSDFMEPAYKGDKSPVEAIIETADKLGMRVFMSSGWAINQDDDLRDPVIRELQQKIMDEAASKFSHHKSFYGWYLPVEDKMEPYFTDHAVDAVNTLSAYARKLTPDKLIMVSPYGLCEADFENPKMAEQIKKMTVDIIAYQDEIGCVREPMPMKRMKDHFKKLGDIHRDTNIRFWANVESFTWEKDDNSRESALVPAAFARYLSQITAVSQAGVEETISFSIYGIFDKPDSEMPIGQPCYSAQAYQDYMDWQAGVGRWQLLEATFKGDLMHDALGKKVQYTTKPSEKFYKGAVTDGKLGEEHTGDEAWVGFDGSKMDLVVDLGKEQDINSVAIRFLQYDLESISLPTIVNFYVSNDGDNFERVKSIPMDLTENTLHDCWIDIAWANDLKSKGRYIKVEADNRSDHLILCDEVLVNPRF